MNWPIPQVVAFNWVASLTGGGGLTYDRATVITDLPTIPANMDWLNNPSYPTSGSGSRHDYTADVGPPPSYAALLGMQEDMQIAEMTRCYLWDPGNPTTHGSPNRQEEQDAKLAYTGHKQVILDSLAGTTDGSTAITDEQTTALVKMMEHPKL